MAAQQRWADINGQQNTWFCGAYWHNGFHEDGVVSALRVTEAINKQARAAA
jgi:predicted NAD/FAD-binding protein